MFSVRNEKFECAPIAGICVAEALPAGEIGLLEKLDRVGQLATPLLLE